MATSGMSELKWPKRLSSIFSYLPNSGMLAEVVPANRRPRADAAAHRFASMANLACHALFLVLLALNVARTLRHAMWRDELQIFQLGRASGSLADLFHHLRYEAHGGLWDAMVWLVPTFHKA